MSKNRTSGAMIANQGDYGIDAPTVVRNLLLIGGLLLILVIPVFLLAGAIWQIVGAILILGGAICLIEAIWMIWSSKFGKRRVVKQMISNLHIKENNLILDVGCGRGFVLHSLAKKLTSGKIIGIDIWNRHDQSGNHAQATLKNAELEGVLDRVEVKHADARQLPFAEHTFDVVVSSLAIHNISVKEERKKAIDEIYRVLKTDGKAALLDFQYTEEYAQMLVAAGFSQVQISKRYFAMFPPVRIVTGVKQG